jgi:SMI1/KNR4 family protein SUKH-1
MKEIRDKLAALGIEVQEPLSEDQIAEVEEAANGRFPDDYRRFLSEFGGSTFSETVTCRWSGGSLHFGSFFGSEELLEAIENLEDQLPDTIISIGDDGGGNLFCLGVSGADIGKVYFHNHSWGWHADADWYLSQGKEVPPDIRYQTVVQIAPSFRQFILNMVNED